MRDFTGHLPLRLTTCLVVAMALAGCREEKPAAKASAKVYIPPATKQDYAIELAATKVELAREKIADQRLDEALMLLIAAVGNDPANETAKSLLQSLTTETVQPLAMLAIPFDQPVEHLAVSGSILFVSLAGESNTLVRWNLSQQRIESVLFPLGGAHTRSLTLGADGKFLVVERAGVTLLCDAVTLKPIRDLGPLPENLTPSAAVVFSPDGLLLAHPQLQQDDTILWQLCDAATGEVIRSTEPIEDGLAASLDRQALRIFCNDGSVVSLPVSPVQEISRSEPDENFYLAAQYFRDGSLLDLADRGAHQSPELSSELRGDLLQFFPWTKQPSIWSGLLREVNAPISVAGDTLQLRNRRAFPLRTKGQLTAVAATGNEIITGEDNGTVTIHQLLPVKDAFSPSPVTVGKDKLEPLASRLAAAKIFTTITPAKSLADALAGEKPELIRLCLTNAKNLPPLLSRLAESRIAWLEGRKADALQGWTEQFPDLTEIRKREDWLGWEQADFTPALEILHAQVIGELTALRLPEHADEAQRKALIDYLLEKDTLAKVGRHRLADAAMEAARRFSTEKVESQATIKLATLSRNLGAAPEPCLRAEALALSTLGDYRKAQPRWVSLITDFPASNHLPSDYSEAATAALETGDPEQAIDILATGLHRFPADPQLAIKAGRIALLAGNADRADEFLHVGLRAGFPDELQQEATALLAISAQRTGADAAAIQFHRDLIALDSSWDDPKTIKALDWPEDLKATLRELIGK